MRYDSPSPEVDILNDKSYGNNRLELWYKICRQKTIKPIKVDVVGTISSGGNDGYNVFMPIKELEKIKIAQSEYEAKKNITIEMQKKIKKVFIKMLW